MAVAADCFDQLMTREEQLRRSKSWFSYNINISIRSASSAVREQFSAIGEKQFSTVFIRCCTVGESPRPAIFVSKPERSVDQSKQDLETRCVICQDTINQKLFLIARLPPVNIWILENSTKCFYIWSVLVPSFWRSISTVYLITMNECYHSTTSAIKSAPLFFSPKKDSRPRFRKVLVMLSNNIFFLQNLPWVLDSYYFRSVITGRGLGIKVCVNFLYWYREILKETHFRYTQTFFF